MKYKPGDLVEIKKGRDVFTAFIIRGTPVSLYVEDRPYRIIDETSYSLISNGKHHAAYEYEIKRKISGDLND